MYEASDLKVWVVAVNGRPYMVFNGREKAVDQLNLFIDACKVAGGTLKPKAGKSEDHLLYESPGQSRLELYPFPLSALKQGV